MIEVDLVADHAIFSKLLEVITGSDPETRSLLNLEWEVFTLHLLSLQLLGSALLNLDFQILLSRQASLDQFIVERAMNGKHYNNAARMFKIVFEVFMKAKIVCLIEWSQASSKDNYLVNFLESESLQNLLSKQDNESLKQCVVTIMPIANLMDGYDEMVLDPTAKGTSAALWMSLISMIQIFLNFQKLIKTIGNFTFSPLVQCCLGCMHMTGKTTAVI